MTKEPVVLNVLIFPKFIICVLLLLQGYDIRATHFHGINRDTNEGGHFHTDLDPEEVEYLAYLNFSEEFIRYDQPQLKTWRL